LTPARPDNSPSANAAARRIAINGGDDSEPSQEVVRSALADVDAFWRREFRKVSSNPYQTVSGGFYAFGDGSVPPCAPDPEVVKGNAFYCSEADVIAWDSVNLVPRLHERYGDLGVGLVFAHEWGHAVQFRADIAKTTVFMEQQADCFAGAWVADARQRNDFFKVTDATLDEAMAGFLELKDPTGSTPASPGAHGTAFDRIRAFQEGVQSGVGKCAAYELDSLPLVGIDFQDFNDYSSGGNLPASESIELTSTDLSDYWASTFSEFASGTAGTSFESPKFEVTDDPASCRGSVSLAAGVRYCPSTKLVTVSQKNADTAHEQIGDFALSTLMGSGWAAAVLAQADRLPKAGPKREFAADCLTGAWTKSVFARDRPDAQLSLSPGDLDEAVTTMLVSASGKDRSATGSGFDRVTAYRSGFIDGLSACAR